MENSAVLLSVLENGVSMGATSVEPSTKKSYHESNGAADVTILPTAASKECGTKAVKNLSPTDVMQENKAPPTAKTPTAGALPLEKLLPFRERNTNERKRVLPPHIKVPPQKLFGYPERYRSPTDAMVSPVSRGLLPRNRRPARTLAPVVPPKATSFEIVALKALENTFQDVVVCEVGREGALNQLPTLLLFGASRLSHLQEILQS